MSTPALITPPSKLKQKAAPLAQAIGKAKKAAPLVPFASVPASERPTRQQGKDEIQSMRALRLPDSGRENWMNNPKVAKRTTDTI